MDEIAQTPVEIYVVEIIPPDRKDEDAGAKCLCCGRSECCLDDDGCGICEECLAP